VQIAPSELPRQKPRVLVRGMPPRRKWARPDSNRRSSLCESDVLTAGLRARNPPGGHPVRFKSHAPGTPRIKGRVKLAINVRISPAASAKEAASASPNRTMK
jgi:hypothetical protein